MSTNKLMVQSLKCSFCYRQTSVKYIKRHTGTKTTYPTKIPFGQRAAQMNTLHPTCYVTHVKKPNKRLSSVFICLFLTQEALIGSQSPLAGSPGSAVSFKNISNKKATQGKSKKEAFRLY